MDAFALGEFGDRTCAGYINEFLTFGVLFRRSKHVFCAADIDSDELFAVIGVDRYHTGAVDADSFGVGCDCKKTLTVFKIAQVSLKHFYLFGNKFDSRITFQNKSTHGISAFEQLSADVCAKKSGCTSDKIKRFHRLYPPFTVCFNACKYIAGG